MIALPQHDPSTTRYAEIEERRGRYAWDHEYLRPFPFLHIPYIAGTGVLSIYDVLAGSFAGLPKEEQASGDWLIRKTLGAGPAIYELLERVPRVQWIGLAQQSRVIAKEKVPSWVAHSLRELIPEKGQGRFLRTRIPNTEQLIAALTDLLLRSVDELSTWVLQEGTGTALGDAIDRFEDNVERVATNDQGGLNLPSPDQLAEIFQGFIKDSVTAVVDSARSSARQLTGREPAQEALDPTPGRAADPYLPEDIKRIIAPAELFVRFMAKMRRYHTVGFDGTVKLANLVTELDLPTGPNPTLDDIEFGRRAVMGTNPVMLTRVHEARDIPSGFAVRDDHLRAALGALGVPSEEARSATLADAAAQGRLFFTDYAILADIPCQDGVDRDFFGQPLPAVTARQRYLPAPYGLFYRWGEGSASGLWPVAITLGRDADEYDVFTPADDADVWSRVKALYLCADFNHHEMATHLAGVHFSLEAFAVATARTLHVHHPVSALLARHMELLLWNNFLGRQTLTNPKGFTEQLLSGRLEDGSIEIMRRHYRASDFSDLHFPRELAKRGVDDAKALPRYPFRDDGLRIWDALRAFVAEYVAHYYPDGESFAKDAELKAWVAELRHPDAAHVAGFPETIGDVDVLTDVLTSIIFRSSAYHSAVNYGQFDLQSDPSHVPGALYADPKNVRETPMGDYLPGGEPTLTQAGVMYVLANLRGSCLTEYSLDWFEDAAVWPMVARFRQRLDAVEREIELANKTTRHDRPYEYLKPSLVTTTANV